MDNELGKNSTGFAISILFASCCAGLSNIFVLIVINRFKPKSSKPINEKEISKDEKEAINASHDKKTSQAELNPGDIQIEMNNLNQ